MVSLVLAGVGGQGIITVANIVGKAALIEGKNAIIVRSESSIPSEILTTNFTSFPLSHNTRPPS